MATAKKSIVRKKTTKKASSKRASKPRVAALKSFQLGKEPMPFMTFSITDQTIFWSVLLILILALGLWVLNIQMDISSILDGVK